MDCCGAPWRGQPQVLTADCCNFPSFPTEDEALESDSWGTRNGQLFFSLPKVFFFTAFTQPFLPRICLLRDSGDHFIQPRCSHCICQGLILVDNLVKVCL